MPKIKENKSSLRVLTQEEINATSGGGVGLAAILGIIIAKVAISELIDFLKKKKDDLK